MVGKEQFRAMESQGIEQAILAYERLFRSRVVNHILTFYCRNLF